MDEPRAPDEPDRDGVPSASPEEHLDRPGDGAWTGRRASSASSSATTAPRPRGGVLVPIQVGRALEGPRLAGMIGDDTGDNIPIRNPNWCELTALYWASRNVQADYYGLCHYRRLPAFARTDRMTRSFQRFGRSEERRFGWDEATVRAACGRYDVMTTPRWPTHPPGLPERIMSNRAMYAFEHAGGDLDRVVEVVRSRSPDVFPFIAAS